MEWGLESGYSVYSKVARDSLGNIVFYGVAFFVSWLLHSWVHWLGWVAFAVPSALVLLSAIQTIFATALGVGIGTRTLMIGSRREKIDNAWAFGANIIRIVEDIILLAAAYILPRRELSR
ncbi:MAG: hypothetical protein ACHQ50_15620 [Fimbriimonadales bacterium]